MLQEAFHGRMSNIGNILYTDGHFNYASEESCYKRPFHDVSLRTSTNVAPDWCLISNGTCSRWPLHHNSLSKKGKLGWWCNRFLNSFANSHWNHARETHGKQDSIRTRLKRLWRDFCYPGPIPSFGMWREERDIMRHYRYVEKESVGHEQIKCGEDWKQVVREKWFCWSRTLQAILSLNGNNAMMQYYLHPATQRWEWQW